MPVPKLLANYTDPVYANLNAEFAQKSDDFPIALLPVRLETKFKTTTQFISQGIMGESVTHFVVTSYYTILRNARIWESKLAGESKAKSLAKVAGFKTQLNRITSKIATVKTTTAETKRVMAEAAEDLLADLKTLKAPAQIQTAITELQEIVALQRDMINALKLPGVSAYELGYQYFNRLQIIEKNIADIYVNGKVNSQNIGSKLDEIDDAIQTIYSLIKEPNFKATTGTMAKIVSKISYIKRLQKNSYVRLQDFRYGFTGNRNLTSDEYTLRKDINALKTRIDEEHIPFMQLQDSLKTYPTVQLQLRITKAYNQLLASNRVGYRSYDELMTAKKVLYDDLLGIRERAHRPLSAVEHEIHELKNAYQNLEEQIVKFIARSKKIKTADRYKRAALSRLETHLTEEYLEDLKDLLPGVKTIEEQTFSDAKVRTTSSAFLLTKSRLVAVRDAVKNISTKGEAGLIAINDQLKKVRPEIAVSASNTILLSKLMFSDLQNTTNSLKSHIDNFVKNNSIDAKNNVLAENKAIVGEIENYIADQQLDVFNARDKFYDKHRKKITFAVNTKTVKELWVRIYPDDIAVDNHDERISPEEEKVGQDYYFEVYKKPEAEREAAKLGAYRAAAASLGVRRAAYVIKALLPDEVKNNTVATYQDDLDELVKQFKVKLSLKTIWPRNSVESREEELRQFIENLPREISRRLNPQNFTCCIETKASLDQFLVQIKTAQKRFFKEVKLSRIRGLSEDKTDVIRILNNAEHEVLAFYKDNLEKLNTPFLPNLHFAEFEYKQKSWDRAGICDVMPDRFVVATKRDGVFQHIVTGNEVEKPLHLSIDPSSNQNEEFNYLPNGDLQVPPKLRWMFDFEAAVLAGMAVKIPLTDEDYVKGFDFVMAFGVQNTEAAIGQETLNKLFTNHLYSDGGLEFLPVGTATNNTENIKSPYNGLDNDVEGAFELFFGSEKPAHLEITTATELEITDGQFFKDAFGLPDDIADFIRYHDKKDIVEGRAMNRALYNATIKYYMHIMVDNLLTENDKDRTIEFLMRNVSAVGTIPTFRIDQQPYGVLPITDYKSFLADGNTNKGTEGSYLKTLAMFLKQTRLAFDGFSKKPQTVNGTKYQNDPQAEFLKILGLEPFSKEFYYRFGTNVSNRWQSDEDIDFPINWDNSIGYHIPQNVADNYTTLLNDLGYTNPVLRKYAIEKTRAYKNRFTTANFIHGPLVQNPELGTESLANITDFDGNYIEWLRQKSSLSDIKDIRVDGIPAVNGENQNTLLFMMLRGGMLYDRSSYVKNALNILKTLEVPKLERLLANHIDLCSYRLDAWMGGLSSHRLNKLRQTNATGTYMGAYGFVADLKRAADRTLVDTLPVGLSPESGENVYRMPDNQGFIHGPSMNHAVAAAVLRAGYTSLKNRGNNNNALAINLSSARVRKALHLLEGVGNGQESGALLGYIFERALHEKYKDGNGNHLEMDTYIYRLRKKFPTFGDLPKEDDDIDLEENESIRAANVVDGLAMLDYFEEQLKNQNFWDDDKTFVEMIIDDSANPAQFIGHPWGFGNEVPNPTNEIERLKLRAIVHELDNMADSFDALGDLMNAEGVYQLVRGNHVRASAVLNALAEGKVPLDPEIINSMRQGIMVTHRASLNVRVPQTTDSPWQNVPLSPRARAENSLNYWLAEQIGNPDDVAWQAIFGNTETYISLQDMGMQAIDLVLLVTAGGDDGMQEIEMRCINYLLAHGAEEDDVITLNFNISPPTANFSFGEIVSLLQNLGKLITNARPSDARDYRIAEDELNFSTTAAGLDLAKLEVRITTALADYKALLASLSPFTPEKLAYTASEVVLAKTKLKELSLWGFAGFYPSREAAANPMDMAARLISAKAAMNNNIAFVENSLANLALELDQGAWLTASTEIAAKLFGSGFKFLPEFNCINALDLRIQLDFDAEESIIRNQPEEFMADWLSTASLVRNRLAPAETVRLLTDVLHQKEISLQPAQLPFDFAKPAEERDYWLGAEYPDSFVPDGDRLSFVCFGHENVAETMCGLIIDEWMEIIPDEKETTGIAFHYNQPDARAPQTILMAVTPQKTGKWNLDEVALAVEEAFNMAKIRAVEPEHIDFSMFSQLLPATSALAFGYDEMMRRESPDENFEADDQVLGMYIDYTAVNHGVEPEPDID